MWFYTKIGPYKENRYLKLDTSKGRSHNASSKGEGEEEKKYI